MPPIDVDATVLDNRRLSRDYNVLILSAPEVGGQTEAGQFVMVRPAGMTDTLLRRPFSIFEVVRDPDGAPTAISILNKRAGRTTNRLYDVEPLMDRCVIDRDQIEDARLASTDGNVTYGPRTAQEAYAVARAELAQYVSFS